MGYGSQIPYRVPLLSTKNKKVRLQWAKEQKHWTLENGKTIAWSDESKFLLFHADERTKVWRKPQVHVSIMSHVNIAGWWWWWWCDGVGCVFMAHIGPLDKSGAMFECHRISEHYIYIYI
jgi:hypothetical protein